jgi:hypothetical protein
MKKVLLVSIAAPPKTGAESIQTGRYLKHISNHFDICLITSSLSQKGWRKSDDSLESYTDYVTKKIEIPTFSNLASRLSRYKLLPSGILYPDADFLFYILGLMSMNQIKSFKPDILYSRSTPVSSAILALKLKKKLKIPWIMHFSDPWVENPYNNWSIKTREKSNRMESLLFESADIITLTSETAVDLYAGKYPHRKQDILYFPNIFDKINEKDRNYEKGKKLRIAYTGNIYKERSINPLIKVVDHIRTKYPDYLNDFEILIAGNIDDYNYKMLKQSDSDIINYLGHLNYSESSELVRSSDILVSIDKPKESEFDNLFLPSKIMDYIAANRIILSITHIGSPTYKIVENQFGKCFNHNEIPLISRFIIEVINSIGKNLMINFNPRKEVEFFSGEYQIKILKKTFEKLLT